ncbi:hypothetical protein [Cellulomonas xiejunii]|uniref:hypothetical protein n=1 Tax=Cellulomonas xiejunii TaxID=2968083 RepID=UPI001D0E3A6E|nr:hypothetical protein [Cellulomonas xiejunii]
MDVRQALLIASTPALLLGRSNAGSAAIAQQGLTAAATAVPVRAFDRRYELRPVDMLLALAYGTRLDYDRTVLDAYMQWALFRYLGAFEWRDAYHRPPVLRLSDAARRVTGNQRRVLSEELGIGLAVSLAHDWTTALYPDFDVHLLDIDAAVEERVIRPIKGKRTDYLVLGASHRTAQQVLLGLVESKGTASATHAVAQLKSGATQLEETWAHMPRRAELPGLVSVMHAGRAHLAYQAVQVLPTAQGPSVTRPAPDPAPISIDHNRWARLTAYTWAKLADLAEDDVLFARVAPQRLKGRRPASGQRPAPVTRRIADRTFRGSEATIPLPGGDLRIFLGADQAILTALYEEDPVYLAAIRREVLSASAGERGRSDNLGIRDRSNRPTRVEAISDDGAGIAISLANQ